MAHEKKEKSKKSMKHSYPAKGHDAPGRKKGEVEKERERLDKKR